MGGTGITREMLPKSPVGLFYAWWRGDSLPDLPPVPGLTVDFDPPAVAIQSSFDLPEVEIKQRFERGNQAVIGRMKGLPAAIGWSCSGQVEIGELGLDFHLPQGDRYLWDFVTLPEWRGRGIYPALLRAFIEQETAVERFWVGHDLDNSASRRGILKTGFQTVGEVYAVMGVGPVFVAGAEMPERAPDAARLLNIPLFRQDD